jgi:hypothetical protein
VEGGTDKPIDAAARRRFNSQRTATLEDGLPDVVFTMVVRQHRLDELGDQFVSVADGCLAEAQELRYLNAVILDRATRPLVARIQLGWDAYLTGNMHDDRGRQLAHVAGEATLLSERLEQQAEAPTRRAGLVGQQLEFIGLKRPMLNQLILRPLPLHRQSPSIGEDGGAAYRCSLRRDC